MGRCVMLPEDVEAAVLASAPRGVSHIGFVAFNVKNHVLVCEPEGQPFGVTATLPRVRVVPGESAASALARCLEQRVGRRTTSAFPLPAVWVTENSTTFYLAGLTEEPDGPPQDEAPSVVWLPVDKALTKIHASKNRTTRNRDVAALRSASDMETSLPRRILLLVRELHRKGFGRLRAAPWMHQNGYIPPPGRWTCSVVPSVVMRDDHGALTDGDRMNRLREALGVFQHHDPFETLGSHRPFGWDDALFDAPEELAGEFLLRFRDLCFAGWGSDPGYQRWYDEMLEATAPNGVFYPLADDSGYVRTAFTAGEHRLPAPPLARS